MMAPGTKFVTMTVEPDGRRYFCSKHLKTVPEEYILDEALMVWPLCPDCFKEEAVEVVPAGVKVKEKKWQPFPTHRHRMTTTPSGPAGFVGSGSRGYYFNDDEYICNRCLEPYETYNKYVDHIDACPASPFSDRRSTSPKLNENVECESWNGTKSCDKVATLYPCMYCQKYYCVTHMADVDKEKSLCADCWEELGKYTNTSGRHIN